MRGTRRAQHPRINLWMAILASPFSPKSMAKFRCPSIDWKVNKTVSSCLFCLTNPLILVDEYSDESVSGFKNLSLVCDLFVLGGQSLGVFLREGSGKVWITDYSVQSFSHIFSASVRIIKYGWLDNPWTNRQNRNIIELDLNEWCSTLNVHQISLLHRLNPTSISH